MNLIHTNRAVDARGIAKADWAALTAISAADAESIYPTEGYVRLAPETVVAIAALLDGRALRNGQTVTTYDFSTDDEDGTRLEAHVNTFGPSLLADDIRAQLRSLVEPFPDALRMLDEIIARRLQATLSTDTPGGRAWAHLKAVNWAADEVEINRGAGNMLDMIRDLGLGAHVKREPGIDAATGEVDFATFAKAVDDNAERTDMPERLREFVACARRQDATHVHWA